MSVKKWHACTPLCIVHKGPQSFALYVEFEIIIFTLKRRGHSNNTQHSWVVMVVESRNQIKSNEPFELKSLILMPSHGREED